MAAARLAGFPDAVSGHMTDMRTASTVIDARSAPAAISILGSDEGSSRAELVGLFDRRNLGFLRAHLEELEGDVLLDCARLDDLDDAAAAALLGFRATRVARGHQVMFRGIPMRCRQKMAACARRVLRLSGRRAPKAPSPVEDRAM